MKTYKVRKGLDTSLKIQGMYQLYFYIWLGTGIVFSLIGVFTFLAFINSDSNLSIWVFCGVILFLIVAFFGLKVLFIKQSNKPKITKGKYSVTISNSDIFEMLRQNDYDCKGE